MVTQTSGSQKYQLFPNPNDGNFIISQLVPDYQPVQGEIWDAIGKSVYKGDLIFNGGIDNLHLVNYAPGLYLLKLYDSNGRIFSFKFVKE